MAVASLDEAIRLANDSEYGLTASGWTRDPRDRAAPGSGSCPAGVVTINDCVYSYGEPTAPWGGVKHSGIGRTHGAARAARDGAGEVRGRASSGSGADLWWYPYGAEFRRLMSAANRALHARVASAAAARPRSRCSGFRRFWQRGAACAAILKQRRQAVLRPH